MAYTPSNPNGQYTMANSAPVVIASNQSALPVSGTFWQATQPVSLTSTTITGTVAATQSGAWSLAANQSVNAAQINGVTPLMGNGATGTGSQRVTIASDNTAFSVNATPVVPTSGGVIIKRTISAATTNATSAKASAGQVYGWAIYNSNAAARWLKLYNKASAPTVGTDTPVMTIMIPGNTAGADNNFEMAVGITFATGIAYAITTGVADADTGAVAANEIVVNLLYK